MIWFALAICFLLTAILAAIKRGPQPARIEPTRPKGLGVPLILGGIVLALIVYASL